MNENLINEAPEIEKFLNISKKTRKKINEISVNKLSRNPNTIQNIQFLVDAHVESAYCIQQMPDFIEHYQLSNLVADYFMAWQNFMSKIENVSFSESCVDADGNIFNDVLDTLIQEINNYELALLVLENEINTYYYLYIDGYHNS